VKSQIAHLPHRSLRYLESGSGRTLVLLHAFPLSADQWLPQLHRVPQGWRFIAPDLRGFAAPALPSKIRACTGCRSMTTRATFSRC
jgi:pimeloyl-ACP methyl ester carboxylesterase